MPVEGSVAEMIRPRTLSEAISAAGSGDRVVIAAGCTDLFPATPSQTLTGRILDLTSVDGLRGILRTGMGWRIGAATTWTDILRADLQPAFDGLKAAARQVGGVQIQNAGTLGGNLCNASPAADGVPPLLTLDAEVELASGRGVRRLPLAEFITGPRRTMLGPGEIMTAVLMPDAQGRGSFVKLGARAYLVISIVMVAARVLVAEGRLLQVAVAVGSCGPVAARMTALEARLTGAPVADAAGIVTADLVAPVLSPIDDVRADAAYRTDAAVELIRRVLDGAMA